MMTLLPEPSPETGTGLTGSLGFMLGLASRRVSLLLTQRLSEYAISPEQWSVLYHIGEREGLIQRELATRSGKDKPTVTRILDHLEAKRLILKQSGPDDRRAFRIYPTAEGRSLLAATIPLEKRMNLELRDALGEPEYQQLLAMLNQLNLYLENHTSKE